MKSQDLAASMAPLRRDLAASPLPLGSLLLLLLAMAIAGFFGDANVWRITAAGTVTLIGLVGYRILRQGDDLLADLLDYGDEPDR